MPVAGRWPAVREKLRGRDVYGVLVNLAKRRVAEVIDEGFKEAFVPCAVLKVIHKQREANVTVACLP